MSESENVNVRPYWNASLNIKFYHRGYDCMFTVRPDEDENPMDALRLVADATEYLDSIGAASHPEVRVQYGQPAAPTAGEPTAADALGDGGAQVVWNDVALPGVSYRVDWKNQDHGLFITGRAEAEENLVRFYSLREPNQYPEIIMRDFHVRDIKGYNEPLTNIDWGSDTWIIQWRLGEKLNQKGNPFRNVVDFWRASDYIDKHAHSLLADEPQEEAF